MEFSTQNKTKNYKNHRYRNTKTQKDEKPNNKDANSVSPKEQVENADLDNPVLSKIMTTRK